MLSRWIAVLGALGVIDVAYIDFVLGPRCFAESAVALAPRAESAGSAALPASASSPAGMPRGAVEPAVVARAGRGSRAPEPELESARPEASALASKEPALAHDRPPGETWWIVNFPEAGASLNPAAEQQLRQIAERVGDSHDVRINIIGHADARGSDDYNRKLGQRRARAVADALLQAGFRQRQIQIVSRGEAAPAVLGASQDAWASNRRAEIEIEVLPRSNPPRSDRP